MAKIVRKITSFVLSGNNPAKYLRVPKNLLTKPLTERQLIEMESELGKKLFGPIPKGHRREFFCLDDKTWIWHEEYIDPKTKQPQSFTTRYELQERAVLKAQNGAKYSYLEGDELQNFVSAVQMYYDQVMRTIYRRDPYSGQKLL